jgi:hypothetical protein
MISCLSAQEQIFMYNLILIFFSSLTFSHWSFPRWISKFCIVYFIIQSFHKKIIQSYVVDELKLSFYHFWWLKFIHQNFILSSAVPFIHILHNPDGSCTLVNRILLVQTLGISALWHICFQAKFQIIAGKTHTHTLVKIVHKT